MKNSFQIALLHPNNRHLIWHIIKLFHPDCPISYISPYSGKEIKIMDKVNVYPQYDWVCIKGKKGTGKIIEIGISINHLFSGMGITLKNFQSKLDNKEVKFRAWRFTLDCEYEMLKGNPEIHEMLIDNNIPFPSAQQMYEYYYRD